MKKHKKTKYKKKQDKKEKIHVFVAPELAVLERGIIPSETKMGDEFKGRNRIIIS